MKIKNTIVLTSAITLAIFWAGCSAAKLLSTITSETPSEKIIPAEFKIAETEGKIAILVNQPGWVRSPIDLRIALTKSINTSLAEKTKIKKNRLIEYTDVLNARMKLSEAERDEPNAIAAKLGASYVLDVQIMDFDLSTFAERDFFNGIMVTKSCLLDAQGNKLWPQENDCRPAKVEIEDEKGTIETSVARLSAATAHCITRYFYNCKTGHFRVTEEHKELDTYDF